MDISNMKYIYYRGYAKDCNYSCSYCPFAKNTEKKKDFDEKYLNKFVEYIENTNFKNIVSIMFTPYGEALTKKYYYDAIARLSKCDQVESVSCQTNASFEAKVFLKSLEESNANFNKIALWASFHKEMTSVEAFTTNILQLNDRISLSVGTVGFKEDQNDIERLRKLLPLDIYLWVNKPEGQKTDDMDFSYIDPLYKLEKQTMKCNINSCTAGIDSILVKENGSIYLCHSSKKSVGNLYQDFKIDKTPLETCHSRTCQAGLCHCYLMYCHRTDIDFPEFIHRQQRYYQKKYPKALFFDIDDTLITKEKNHLDGLKSLTKEYDIYFVTGRNYDSAIKLCKINDIKGGVFGYGAYIKTPDECAVTYLESSPTQYKISSRNKLNCSINEKIIEDDGIYHIVHNSVSKLSGIKYICKKMNYISDDIWVIGNGEQDVEMLASFPYSFAVKNAHQRALKSASFILDIKEIFKLLERGNSNANFLEKRKRSSDHNTGHGKSHNHNSL